jgi:hypothetical protein
VRHGAAYRDALVARDGARGTQASADYAELNAITAGLYALSGDDYAHVLDSFPLVPLQQRQLCLSSYEQLTRNH